MREGGKAMATDSHPMDRSEQESESQPSSRPTQILDSVISSSLSSHTPLHQHACAVSALQSKVTARSERKAIWKQLSKKKEDRRVVPGFYKSASSHAGAWGFSSSDEDIETCAEDLAIHTVEDRNIITTMRHGEGIFLENITDNNCNAKQDFSLCLNKPPKGFWRIAKQEPVQLNGAFVPGREDSKSGVMPKHTALRTDPSVQEEITRSDVAENHPQSCRPSDSSLAASTGNELWRAESLESICSSGSSLSLAERVEMNRTILRQMLQKAQKKSSDAIVTDPKMKNTQSRGKD